MGEWKGNEYKFYGQTSDGRTFEASICSVVTYDGYSNISIRKEELKKLASIMAKAASAATLSACEE